MQTPVSVIIATHQRPLLLQAAIASVLEQTHAACEVLVCEDGASEATRAVVDATGCDRVRWLPGSHSGRPAVPRNRGLARCRGEWIAILDDDDTWLPHKLEHQLRTLAGSGHLAACTNALRVTNDPGVTGPYFDSDREQVTFRDLLESNLVICSSALFHRSLLVRVNGFPEEERLRASEDYAFWLRIASYTHFAYHGEPLLHYRDDPLASIRRQGPPQRELRMNILGDYLAWSRQRSAPWWKRMQAGRHFRRSASERAASG